MSKNGQDEPDELEVIFDATKLPSEQDTVIDASNGDTADTVESPTGFIDVELGTSDDFITDSAPETEDQDIEDGIFAPVRREKPEGKKSASLMFAVSLLAIVGVGAVVYVSNPDIISKVTSNLASNENITIPNDTSATDTAEVAHDENVIAPAPDATNISADIATIKPDEVTTDVAADVPHDVAQDVPPSLEHTKTEIVDPSVVATTAPVDVPPVADAPVASAPVADASAVVASTDVPVVVDATTQMPPENQPIAAPAIEANIGPTPSVSDVVPPTPATDVTVPSHEVTVVPSSDVITATNDRDDDVIEATDGDAAQSTTTTSIVAAPAEEPVATAPAADPQTETSKKNAVAAKDKTPVIVMSKEEKKALDDANLNQYFDSPSGKIIKEIPAPSMNAKKGGNQSIIVVNKKAPKPEPQYSKPSGKVTIETTSLTAQMVSANRALKLGRYDAAKEMYDDLYKLNPRDAQILSGRAILLQKMGFADQAIAAYEELLTLYPDNTDATVNLAGLIRKQYPAVALSKLLDLHMKVPNNAAVTAQLGVAYADSGNYSDALRYLTDASTIEPRNALHFFNMAVISEKASKPAQAISYYEKALELDAIYGDGQNTISREKIYDRLAQIRGN